VGAVLVHEFMTLDGVIDAPTWTMDYGFDPRMGAAIGGVTERCRGITPTWRNSTLSLAACEAYENGVVHLAYRP
jgi:hypothetical protein